MSQKSQVVKMIHKPSMKKQTIPCPLIDAISNNEIKKINLKKFGTYAAYDLELVYRFLGLYDGNESTFINYRKEIERLLHWSWIIAKKSIIKLRREDIEKFIKFCQKPLKSWIGTKIVPRFITQNSVRLPNPEWRPFVVTINKTEVRKGKKPHQDEYMLSQKSVKAMFVILGSFYTHLINENVSDINPVLQIRQKSKFIRKQQNSNKVPCLSETQWKCLIKTTQKMAENKPVRHQRTLFIISAMYLMYLRISEVVGSSRWTPLMGNFYKDGNNNWWFITVGKGNKERNITVSDSMLDVLKQWRKYLGLTLLPYPNDTHPLIPKSKGQGAVTSVRMIRQLIQECFDETTRELIKKDEKEEASTMAEATVHWLRHTGISDDINKRGRPIIHVRDDAGHASIATTDKYNDSILRERHSSGKNKKI